MSISRTVAMPLSLTSLVATQAVGSATAVAKIATSCEVNDNALSAPAYSLRGRLSSNSNGPWGGDVRTRRRCEKGLFGIGSRLEGAGDDSRRVDKADLQQSVRHLLPVVADRQRRPVRLGSQQL